MGMSAAEYKKALANREILQNDFSEGIAKQVPSNKMPLITSPAIRDHIVHDVRYRIEAYGYCNLLCFYRVDYEDRPIFETALCDEENIAYLANRKGIWCNVDELRNDCFKIEKVLKDIVKKSSKLSRKKLHLVCLPPQSMDMFGDMVIIIRNKEEFCRRVIDAVTRLGDDCILGDVKYHNIEARANALPAGSKPHITVFSDGLFDLSKLNDDSTAINYGCLDKYVRYSYQNEWRVCWLPKTHNNEGKVLHVGSLKDIIEIVPREKIRERLMDIHPGYIPSFTKPRTQEVVGTISYDNFRNKVESIDGKCRIIMDMG